MQSHFNDEHFMQHALREAQTAFDAGEVPVGAVIVMNNKILSRGHNMVERLNDTTAHAEMIAITAACNGLGSKYLTDATLYVTIEPCHMCAGAIYWSKVKRIVFGACDPKQGYQSFCGAKNPFHPKAEIVQGIMAQECSALIKEFFRLRR